MSTHGSRSDLIVRGYLRELRMKLSIDIPDDIFIVILMFYPNGIDFIGNTMDLTLAEKDLITSWFIDIFDIKDTKSIISSELLYDYNKDGRTGTDYHNKCDGNINTFSIIETEFNGHIFGCFLSRQLEEAWNPVYMNDKKAFLCIIRPAFKDKDLKPQMFEIIQNKSYNAYYNTSNWGPAFGSDDLTLLGDQGVNDVNHSGGYFDKSLCGNML